MGHGGDPLHICKSKKSSKCNMENRWLNAMMRAAEAYRKSSRGVVRAKKARVKKWLAKSFDLSKGAAKLRSLRDKIHKEHHALLARVEKMFRSKGGMRPRVPLSGYIR